MRGLSSCRSKNGSCGSGVKSEREFAFPVPYRDGWQASPVLVCSAARQLNEPLKASVSVQPLSPPAASATLTFETSHLREATWTEMKEEK